MSEPNEEDLVLLPKRELDALKARVADLEQILLGSPAAAVDPIAEQFGAFKTRIKDLERQGARVMAQRSGR